MSVYINKKFISRCEMPNHDIDPEIKQTDPEWCLQAAQYSYNMLCEDKTAITASMRMMFKENVSYADGCQNSDIYKDRILGKPDDMPNIPVVNDHNEVVSTVGNREGWANVNFDDIFSPAPKLIQNITGIMQRQHHSSVVNAIDPMSAGIKESMRFMSMVNKEYGNFIKAFSAMVGIPESTSSIANTMPLSVEELEIFGNIGSLKLSYEIGLGRALVDVSNLSHEKEIFEKCIYSMLTTNFCCVCDEVVAGSQVVKKRFIPIENALIEYDESYDFDNSNIAGFYSEVSLYDLKLESGLTDDDLFKIIRDYDNVLGNKAYLSDNSKASQIADNYSYRIPVLTGFIRTTDKKFESREIEAEINKSKVRQTEIDSGKIYERGGKYFKKVGVDDVIDAIDTVYTYKWVIGSKYIYNFGRLHDIAYDFKTKRAVMPIHVVGLRGKPMMSSIKPILDEIAMVFLKFQNNIAKAAPPGIAIDVGTMENITYDGKPFTVKENLSFYSQTGDLLYRLEVPGTVSKEGGGSRSKPFEEIKGGMGTAVADALAAFELLYRQMAEVSGVDRFTSVSEGIKSNQGLGVTEIAVAATSNTLQPVYQKWLSILKRTDYSALLRIIGIIYSDPTDDNYYKNVIGVGAFSAIVALDGVPPLEIGITIEPKPSDEVKAEIKAAARESLAGGKNGIPALTYGEYLFIVSNIDTNAGLEFAKAFITYKEGKKKELEQQLSEQNMKAQSDNMIRLEQAKTKEETTRDEILTNNKIKVIKAEAEEKRKTEKELEKERRETLLEVERLKIKGEKEKLLIKPDTSK